MPIDRRVIVSFMNSEAILEIINRRLETTSQRELAKELGVSPQYLHDVINGRRSVGTEIPKALGLEKHVEYKRAKR